MSIATRIEAIEQHITDDYSVLELAGADLTNVDKNIENLKQSWEERLLYFLANGTDVVWNNWLPKINGTGETITLNNTIEAKMDFVYKGNTYQYSTSGKNLINDYDLINRWHIASVSDNLLTTTATSSDWDTFQPITRNQTISLVQGTEYYVSFDMRLKSGTYSRRVSRTLIIDTDGNGLATNERVVSQPTMTSSFQRMVFKQTANTTTDIRIGLMIQIQYGANNAVFEIKNIMISTSSDTTYEEYTGNQPSPSPDYPQNIQVVSGDNTIIVSNSDNTQSQSYEINLGDIELCKIGDYQDKIYKDNGKWYLNKQIGKVVLDGSENWSTTDSGTATQMFATNIGRTMGERSTIPIYSNMYKYVFWNYGPWDVNNSISYYSTDKIRIKDNAKANVDDFKTWLSTHNTTVYYVLATPTTTEITDTTLISQLEAIKKSYNNQTNISQTNADKPFILDVVALGELEI